MVSIILAISYANKLTDHSDKANCAFSSIPSDLLSGISNNDFEFLGFSNILTVLNNFYAEKDQIKADGMSANFDALISAKINSFAKLFKENLALFKNSNKGKKILIVR